MVINTLVTIKDSITAFADGHGQLQGRVIFEVDDHRSAYITEENTYPLLFVAPIDVQPTRAMNVHTLRVYVYERINNDRLDVWENANDTSLILRDIRVWWNDYGVDDIQIVEDPIGQFGCDKELDNLVGYFADIRFEIPSHGRCQVPVNVTPSPTPSCADATAITTDSLGNQLYSNTIPSGGTLTQPIQDSVITLKDTALNVLSITNVLAEGVADITAPDATYLVEYVNGTDIQSGSIVSGGSVTVTVPNPIVCADTTIEVNGTTEGTVVAGSTVDVQLSDSGGVVTPASVTQVGNDLQIVLSDAPLDLFWELNYNGTDDVIFIPATVNNVGTLTSGSGSNVGTITVSTDGVTYGALSFPFTPVATTTYYFKRSTATVTGAYIMTGSYV